MIATDRRSGFPDEQTRFREGSSANVNSVLARLWSVAFQALGTEFECRILRQTVTNPVLVPAYQLAPIERSPSSFPRRNTYAAVYFLLHRLIPRPSSLLLPKNMPGVIAGGNGNGKVKIQRRSTAAHRPSNYLHESRFPHQHARLRPHFLRAPGSC